MQRQCSPRDAYRRVDFEARIAGAGPAALVLLCYDQLASALGTAIHAAGVGDNARKSAALARALSAIAALQLGLDRDQPIATALIALFESARQRVLDSVLQFDAESLDELRRDVVEIAAALNPAAQAMG